jgi:GNAT superfamily N-acetyltransferase
MRIVASSYYGDEDDIFYKALEGGEEIGRAGIMYDECRDDCMLVHSVWVDENFRRKGLATKMMKKIVSHYPDKPMYLYVSRGRDNKAAVTLYSKFGFEFASDDVEDDEMIRKPKKNKTVKRKGIAHGI